MTSREVRSKFPSDMRHPQYPVPAMKGKVTCMVLTLTGMATGQVTGVAEVVGDIQTVCQSLVQLHVV